MTMRSKKKVIVVLGSGGHTSEMLSLLKAWDADLFDFRFILADTDKYS